MDAVTALIEFLKTQPGFDPEAFDPDRFVAELTDEQVQMVLGPILAEAEQARYGKFGNFFPDATKVAGGFTYWARELYPKHLEFFRATKAYREICFMAGNRCITPWTYLETPAGLAPAANTWTAPLSTVRAWDGESRCDARAQNGYVVGIEPAFRLVMDNGLFVDCSRKHRVLTDEGYLSLDQLMSRAGGLRSWHRREDYQANCAKDGYLGDQPLLRVAGIDLTPPPSQGGVQGRGPLWFSQQDAEAHTRRYSHAFQLSDRLSTRDDLARLAGLFGAFAGGSSCTPVLRPTGSSRARQQLALGLAPRLRSGLVSADGQPLVACRVDAPQECHADQGTRPRCRSSNPEQPLSLDAIYPGGSTLSSLQDEARIATFYPSFHPSLVGGNRIICVVPLGYQPIIDAQIPGFSNYIAGGIVNHNCGKTIAGAYLTSVLLTGRYPHWWEGRVFRNRIDAWVAGDTNETTRDILQLELLGEVTYSKFRKTLDGSGLIPRECIGDVTWKQGVANLVDTIFIKHKNGGESRLGFKSYDQGRRVFQGTAKHLIWLDEECPEDVYGECLIRTATTRGIIPTTFTPLKGISEVVMSFMDESMRLDA